MEKYSLIPAIEESIPVIMHIYNSNPQFLESHLGCSSVDETFVKNELKESMDAGFSTALITNDAYDRIVGFCDFRQGETVYLSLLMMDGMLKGQGLGKEIYHFLETQFKEKGAASIRIDVLWQYEGNVLGFWRKQGFSGTETVSLNWNSHHSKALKMHKKI